MSTWWMKYKDAVFSLSNPLHTMKVQDFGHSFSLILPSPLVLVAYFIKVSVLGCRCFRWTCQKCSLSEHSAEEWIDITLIWLSIICLHHFTLLTINFFHQKSTCCICYRPTSPAPRVLCLYFSICYCGLSDAYFFLPELIPFPSQFLCLIWNINDWLCQQTFQIGRVKPAEFMCVCARFCSAADAIGVSFTKPHEWCFAMPQMQTERLRTDSIHTNSFTLCVSISPWYAHIYALHIDICCIGLAHLTLLYIMNHQIV